MFPPSRQPCLQGTRRSVTLSTGPRSQPHKCFLVFAKGKLSCSCSSRCRCQVPRGNQVCARLAALPWRSGLRLGCVWPGAWRGTVSPPRWEGNGCARFYFMGHNLTSWVAQYSHGFWRAWEMITHLFFLVGGIFKFFKK